jgi:bacteriorhodopsin
MFATFEWRGIQYAYLSISAIFYLYIICTLFTSGRSYAGARHAKVSKLFTHLASYTVVVWTMFPIVWVLGEGNQRISVDTEITLYMVVYSFTGCAEISWILLPLECLGSGCYWRSLVFTRLVSRLQDGGSRESG